MQWIGNHNLKNAGLSEVNFNTILVNNIISSIS